MKTRSLAVVCLCSAVIAIAPSLRAAAPATQAVPPETREQHDARMKWWRDARFGMFIHFGLYSTLAGEWNGTKTKGAGEWIMNDLHIPVKDYEKLTSQFNPEKFDAKRIVQIAKDAGMKYIVITSKHHEGFALFDSKAGPYNVMATPFKRDIMKELADAAHDGGIQICWYHSIMDWHHPDAESNAFPKYNDGQPPNPKFDRYVRDYLKPQVKELLTNYGRIGLMWFDGEWINQWTDADGQDLYNWCRAIQPDVIVNNRVTKGRSGMEGFSPGKTFAGDYGTPEQQIPKAAPAGGVDWETCMTMNGTWGFKKDDNNWKSSQTLIRDLIDIASKGGNFLLNVGPTGEGEIPPASVERLEAIGKWMAVNGEAIHGTTGSPFGERLPWGEVTQKPGKLYLHVTKWPGEQKSILVPITNKATKAYIMASPDSPLKVSSSASGITVEVPAEMPDKDATVIALEIEGGPQVIAQTTTTSAPPAGK